LPQIAALWAPEDLKLNIGLLANETTLVDQPKYGCVDREWMRLRQNCRNGRTTEQTQTSRRIGAVTNAVAHVLAAQAAAV